MRRAFRTTAGHDVPAVTADEMREVDRVAVEEVGLQLLQMMENAGRTLAWHVREVRGDDEDVVVTAGAGGNGGGGMACARHLANRDVPVTVVLDRPPEDLEGAAAHQHRILDAMGVPVATGVDAVDGAAAGVAVDALVGYGVSGALRSPVDGHVRELNRAAAPVVSLDVPSGVDATTGETRGVAVAPSRTVTLALPKPGLDAVAGELVLADIGIPATVYDRLDIAYESPFGRHDWVDLEV